MKHTLSITNGASLLASSILHIPESFENPAEVVRASQLIERFNVEVPGDVDEKSNDPFYGLSKNVEVTEKERDLLKKVVTKNARMIPPGKPAVSLLTALGMTED